jgi:hypothetical protein
MKKSILVGELNQKAIAKYPDLEVGWNKWDQILNIFSEIIILKNFIFLLIFSFILKKLIQKSLILFFINTSYKPQIMNFLKYIKIR